MIADETISVHELVGKWHGALEMRILPVSKALLSYQRAMVEDPYIVASALSDGLVHNWDVQMANEEKMSPLAEANSRSRLTCLAGSSIKCDSEFEDEAETMQSDDVDKFFGDRDRESFVRGSFSSS
ncbi:p21-activated kinase-interacting 1-like [Olea europaea subsp. europaea]|uniref:p21-activated kinase-interacting 1-like n=1 Tax=Olea europaea subsp. europaea TaxID=158383 RepID=A0A8S0V8I0_OLEEU|nr:p21-activated kinase-interacting 1-like [Olea europaea subsp. europaea]